MKNEFITLSDGHKIPALGVGTWLLQGKDCTKVTTAALDMGYLHIDTAETYENQTEIAPALKGRDRETLWITSKLWRGDYTKERIPLAVDKMLRDLGTDYLDLLLIHWPDRAVPIEESMEAMEKERQKGKIRSIGMSNSTQRHIQDALDTGVKVVVNQVEYHPYFNQNELREWCHSKGVTLTAYSPLAHGKVFEDQTLAEIGQAHGKNAGQVACRWAYQKGMVVLAKTKHVERLKPNSQIFDFELTPADMAKIEALDRNERQIFPDFQEFDYV
jgi:2,5-diketo-D-gluconate reductase B